MYTVDRNDEIMTKFKIQEVKTVNKFSEKIILRVLLVTTKNNEKPQNQVLGLRPVANGGRP